MFENKQQCKMKKLIWVYNKLIIIERRLFSKFGHEPVQIKFIKQMIDNKFTI